MIIKKVQIILAIFLLYSLIFPGKSYAHGSGFPPFFKIDDKIAAPYFLQNVGVVSSSIDIPQDSAERNFLIGDEIKFEIDQSSLATVYPPEVMSKIKYIWDFGDSQQAFGTKNSYSYKKIGSYILKITADFQDPRNPPQYIETVLINIVPDNTYQLPKAIIKINEKQSSPKNYNILGFDLNNALTLDATESYSKSSSLSKYNWDFGDENTSTEQKLDHQYQLPQSFATVVLRVTDKNGFFNDTYVNIKNIGKNDPNDPEQSQKNQRIVATVGGIVAFLGVGYVFLKLRKKKVS